MVLKLGMEKACDRMDWNITEGTTKDAFLPIKMIEAIMGIISGSKC